MSATEEFRTLLRHHRTRAGQTQQQLADLSALSVRAVRDLELGRVTQPRRDTVRLLADGLRLTGRTRADFEAAAGHGVRIRDLEEAFGSATVPPAPLDSIIGRQAEVSVLEELLTLGERLVTITGLTGVGKTRVALEVAGRLHRESGFPVLWASASDLAAPGCGARQSDKLASPIQAGLDALLNSSGDGPVDELMHMVGRRPSLLVLDGYHAWQLRAERIVPLLEGCPDLRMLITSTMPLGVRSERALPLAPLAAPEPEAWQELDRVASAPSVQLLLRHVRHAIPGFELTESSAPAVAELCDRLDGIPAALAAIASWFMLYEPGALLCQIRADPYSYAVRPGDAASMLALREALEGIVAALAPLENRLLATLAAEERSWTVTDAASCASIDEVVCAAAIRRLIAVGVLRTLGEERSRFRVLNLVRDLPGALGRSRYLRPPMRHVAPRGFRETA